MYLPSMGRAATDKRLGGRSAWERTVRLSRYLAAGCWSRPDTARPRRRLPRAASQRAARRRKPVGAARSSCTWRLALVLHCKAGLIPDPWLRPPVC